MILFMPDGMSVDGATLARWYCGGEPLAMDALACGLVLEFEDCAALARKHGVSLEQVYCEALRAAQGQQAASPGSAGSRAYAESAAPTAVAYSA